MRTLRGPGAPARLLQLLLPASLVLAHPEWPLRAANGSAQPLLGKPSRGGGDDGEQLSLSAMEIPPSHYPANRAASVVLHYIAYQRGSPNRLFEMGRVNQASLEVSPEGRQGGRQRRGLRQAAPRLPPGYLLPAPNPAFTAELTNLPRAGGRASREGRPERGGIGL